jgi:hypothetical protein
MAADVSADAAHPDTCRHGGGEQAVFEPRDGQFVPSELARGPWDPDAQHGGAPAALLMRAFERLEPMEELMLARVTYEFLRPVPLDELQVDAQLVRAGRRVQLLEGVLRTAQGIEVVRARALRVRRAEPDVPRTQPSSSPPGPEQGDEGDYEPPMRPMFAPDAIEIRFVAGRFGGGPSTAWFRMRVPLVAGESPSPLQRLAAAGDFGNGISATLSWDGFLFINADLTLYVEREPMGEWICLDSQTIIAPEGVGAAESVLYDQRGRVGRASQALLVAAR